jgi:hypothetical protein
MAFAPVALSSIAGAAAVECTCVHGDHAICPMHHQRAPDARCSLRSTNNDAIAVFSSLLAGIGLPRPAVSLAGPFSVTSAAWVEFDRLFTRPTAPDPPPPRA